MLDVYTIGGIDIITQVYKSLTFFFGDNSYQTLTKSFTILGVAIAAVYYMFYNMDTKTLGRHMLIVTFVYNACFTVKTDVTIIDTKTLQSYMVSNVPYFPALIHSVASTAKMYFIAKTDANFGTGTVSVWTATGAANNQFASTQAGYLRTGYAGYYDSYAVLKKLEFNKIADPDIIEYNSMLDSYIYQCFAQEMSVMDKKEVVQKVMSQGNMLTAIQPTVDQIINYNGMTTCYELYDDTKFFWENIVKPKFAEPKFLAYLGVKDTTTATFSAILQDSLQSGAMNISDTLGQAATMKALTYASERYKADNSVNYGDMAMMYNVGMDTAEKEQLGKSIFASVREMLPYSAIFTEALFIALLPITALLILLPGNGKLLIKFIVAMTVLTLWEPILATINGFVTTIMVSQMKTALSANNATGVFSMIGYNTMMEVSNRLEGVAGFVALGAQSIAAGLIIGGEMSLLNAVSNRMSGGIQTGDVAKNIAPSLEAQKLSKEIGDSYGAMSYYSNSGNMGMINAYAYSGATKNVGARVMLEGGMGAYENGASLGIGHKKMVDRYGASGIAENTFRGGMISFEDTAGKFEGYNGNPNLMRQTSLTQTRMGVGGAQYDAQLMDTGMFRSEKELQSFKQTGQVTEAMASRYGISTNAKAVWAMNDDGNIMIQSAAWNEDMNGVRHSYNYNGSQTTESFVLDGMSHNVVTGSNGDVVEHRATQDLQQSTKMFGKDIAAGAHITRSIGADGQSRTEIKGTINGRDGTLVAQDGKMIFTDSTSGEKTLDIMSKQQINEDMNINRKLKEISDINRIEHLVQNRNERLTTNNDINENRKEVLVTDNNIKQKRNENLTTNNVINENRNETTATDINKKTVDKGDSYNNAFTTAQTDAGADSLTTNMMNSAMNKNIHAGQFDKKGYFDTLRENMTNMNMSLASGASSVADNYNSRQNTTTTSTSAGATVGGNIPLTNIGGSVSVSKGHSEFVGNQQRVNADMGILTSSSEKIFNEYKTGKIDSQQFHDKYSSLVNNFSEGKIDKVTTDDAKKTKPLDKSKYMELPKKK